MRKTELMRVFLARLIFLLLFKTIFNDYTQFEKKMCYNYCIQIFYSSLEKSFHTMRNWSIRKGNSGIKLILVIFHYFLFL